MRVAVCVSGIIQGNYINRNNIVQKQKFPNADFYYATWTKEKEKFEQHFPNEKCFFFDEPTMHYHPYYIENYSCQHYETTKKWIVSGKEKRLEWSSHHTKQILIHAWLLDKIQADYDVIVRTRFDAFIRKDSEANFTPYVEDSYLNKRTNGFAVTRQNKFEMFYESDYVNQTNMRHIILDQLIIHPRNLFDVAYANHLHESKQLRPAEFGWFQILSEPHGNNHRNFHGFVNHDKNIFPIFLSKA